LDCLEQMPSPPFLMSFSSIKTWINFYHFLLILIFSFFSRSFQKMSWNPQTPNRCRTQTIIWNCFLLFSSFKFFFVFPFWCFVLTNKSGSQKFKCLKNEGRGFKNYYAGSCFLFFCSCNTGQSWLRRKSCSKKNLLRKPMCFPVFLRPSDEA
jgi:hypothetical protein